MPPKNVAGGGGVSAAESAKTVSKKKAVPLERVLQISLLQHDTRMSFDFAASVVPDIAPFESSWIEDEVTCASLVSAGPQEFPTLLRTSFPEMTAPVRTKLLLCFKTRINEEHLKGGNFISPDVAKLWLQQPEPHRPLVLFPPQQAAFASREVIIGQPSHAYFSKPPPALHGLPGASAFPGHFQPTSPSSVAANPRSSSDVSFQSPPVSAALAHAPASAVAQGLSTGAAQNGQSDGASSFRQSDGASSQVDLQFPPPPISVEDRFASSRLLFKDGDSTSQSEFKLLGPVEPPSSKEFKTQECHWASTESTFMKKCKDLSLSAFKRVPLDCK